MMLRFDGRQFSFCFRWLNRDAPLTDWSVSAAGTTDTPKVYDVSSYLDDHPGGAEVMLEVAGQDATNMFEDIGHSTDARQEMKKFFVGNLKVQ